MSLFSNKKDKLVKIHRGNAQTFRTKDHSLMIEIGTLKLYYTRIKSHTHTHIYIYIYI